MQGQLANLISLVACGNSYLAFDDQEALERAKNHFGVTYIYPDFLFEQHLAGPNGPGSVIASSPDDWFCWLQSLRVTRLSYVAFAFNNDQTPGLTEAVAAGFSGGISMAIQTEAPGALGLWYPAWIVDRSDLQPGLVWRVSYHGTIGHSGLVAPFTVEFASQSLEQQLLAAADFARRNTGDGPWESIFNKALATLGSSGVPPRGPLEALPRYGYSDAARRFLASADQAWVFGGMGNWNDLGWSEPELQAEYNSVAGKLYDAVKPACVAAANAFDPALHP